MTAGGGDHSAGFAGAERLVAIALLVFMGTAWGGAVSLAKLATVHGGHPAGVALWQTTGSGAMLLTFAVLRGRLPPLLPAVLKFNFVCGFVGLAIPAVGLIWSAKHLPAGVVAIAFASMPLFTYGLSAIGKVESLERLRLLGVALGLTAVALIVLPEAALPAPGLAPWVLLALASSFSMSVENFYIALRRPVRLDSLTLSCGRQLAAAVVLAPVVFALGTAVPLFVAWGPVQWSASGMAVVSGLAYTTLLHVIRTAGPVFASQSAYIITLAGVFWGMALFGERHSPYIWTALVLMLLGLALVRPRRGARSA